MKTRVPILILAAVVVSLFTGCVTPKGPLYPAVKQAGSLTPPKDKGLVIVYYGPQRQSASVRVTGNGKLLTELIKRTFYAEFFNPGPLHLGTGNPINKETLALQTLSLGPLALVEPLSNQPKDYVTIDVKPGEIYYIKVRFGFAWDELRQVSASEAEKALPFCHSVNQSLGY